MIGTLVGGGFGGKEDIAGQITWPYWRGATGRPVELPSIAKRAYLCTRSDTRHGSRFVWAPSATELWLPSRLSCMVIQVPLPRWAKVMTRATTHSAGPYVISNT